MSEAAKTILVRGAATDLGAPVVAGLLARGACVAVHDAARPDRMAELAALPAGRGVLCDLSGAPSIETDPDAAFAALHAQGHEVDAVVHLHLPDADTDAAALRGHNDRLRPLMESAIEQMRQSGRQGLIVNQFLMPTLFADHPLAAAMVEARNGVTALTRLGCLKGGRDGVRVLGLMLGLLDLPSLRALATPRVAAAKTPLGRWITPAEVAATIAFLVLDSGYMSGQTLVLDGGMTGGINGV